MVRRSGYRHENDYEIHNPDIFEILFSFQGRLNRVRFWVAFLGFNLAWGLLWQMIFVLLEPQRLPFWMLYSVYFSISLWVDFALFSKRYHDIGRTGWWSLLIFLPVIGPIWLLIELGFFRGEEGRNHYGNAVIGSPLKMVEI